MWIWSCDLQRLGFCARSERYWQCEVGHGLPDDTHLSIFIHHSDGKLTRRRTALQLLDFCAFHVTFLLEAGRIHFYYHEISDNIWEPGGHTSSREIRRHDVEPRVVRRQADHIASRLVSALGGELRPRNR